MTDPQQAEAQAQLEQALAEHQECINRWDALWPGAQRGATIHSLDVHLPPGHPARQP